MENKIVFVIGAGFSREAGFPLTKDFTDKDKINQFRKSLIKSERIRLDKVAEYFFNRIEEKYCENNIESVLNHIAVADYLLMEATEKDEKTYPSGQIFADLLWYLTKILQYCSSSPVPEEYEKFVKYAFSNKFPIISFNYDLIIEEILHKLEVESDYGFDTTPVANSLFLMKMHGSVNWTFCSTCNNIIVFSDYQAVKVLENKSICSECNNSTLESIIIPPILYKDAFYKHPKYEDLIRQLWGFANDELVNADKIIFIGFSLAETDAYAQELFKLSSNMNENTKYVLVTNPKSKKEIKKLQERYEKVLVGKNIKIIQKTFCQYVKEFA